MRRDIRKMAFKLGTSCAERSFCFIAILIAVFAATLRAQTSVENDAYPFSSSVLPLSLCGQSADGCLLNSAAVGQDGLNLNDADSSNSRRQDDWVHSWARKVDEARARQPHFVSPIVTTHVMLVQQYRYDMSWQQDPTGGTLTSNYGASRGLEIIPTTRLEVGLFPPSYLVHQSKVPDGFGDFSWQVKFRAFSATEHKGDYFVGFFLGGSFHSPERPRPHRLVPHVRSREGHRTVGHPKHDWRKSSNHWGESPGPRDCLQYRGRL
jgi:hypothetical protein